ncbi:probable peptidoglycan muropeptide transporter SLC46 [Diabrotica undecimpunctata]|uniref:probable peptidoglycan muropeptide transporter SLC46 n=1 Tax=Diabrotica undecimpunctata TaxID=50387 RepID=UPI003B63B966
MSMIPAASIHSLVDVFEVSKCGPTTQNETPSLVIKTKVPLCKKLKGVAKNITVEPILLLSMLAHVVSALTVQNLILEKSCRVHLVLSNATCNTLTYKNKSDPEYLDYEKKVQVVATSMFIWRDAIMSLIPSMLLLFIGSWSDRYKKRKHIILNVTLGDIFTTLCWLISTFYFCELPLEVTILGEVLPAVVTGGQPVASMAFFSYISAVSSEHSRTARMGLAHAGVTVVIGIGNLISGILFHQVRFYGVFAISFILYTTVYFYGLFFIKDIWEYKRDNGEVLEKPSKDFLNDFFDIKHVYQTLQVAFKKREDRRRRRIFLTLLLTLLSLGPLRGEANLIYYFSKLKFGWSPVDFSLFITFQFAVYVSGSLFGLVILHKCFKVDDCILGMICCISKIMANCMYALGTSCFYMMIGATLDVFGALFAPVLRSIGSKLVSTDELGKFHSLFSIVETLSPLIFSPIHSKVYAMTINKNPGSYYLVTVVSLIPTFLIFILLYWQSHSRTKKPEHQQQDESLIRSTEA